MPIDFNSSLISLFNYEVIATICVISAPFLAAQAIFKIWLEAFLPFILGNSRPIIIRRYALKSQPHFLKKPYLYISTAI